MPEIPEKPERDLSSEFEDWMNVKAEDGIGVTVFDLDMMEVVILVRLRSVFTQDQLHKRAHAMITFTEQVIDSPGGLMDEHGNPQPAMKAEDFQGTRQELSEMLNATAKGITDEDLENFFLDTNQGEEE